MFANARGLAILAFVSLVGAETASLYAAVSDEACRRMSLRLRGVPPSAAELATCRQQATAYDAALAFTVSNIFLSEVKDNFAPTNNEDGNYFVPLDDYLATVMGFARDDRDFREILYGNNFYTCNAVPAGGAALQNAYSVSDNLHYEECEQEGDFRGRLQAEQIQVANPIFANNPTDVPAGIYTLRGFGCMIYEAGTNRAAFRWTLAFFLGEVIDKFADSQTPDYRVRRDVTRQPGGSATVYETKCKTCHGGMDPMADAWAFNDCVEDDNGVRQLTYTKPAPGATPNAVAQAVVQKYASNANTTPQAYRTVGDAWTNQWNRRANTRVEWNFPVDTDRSGTGPKAFGQMIAETGQFKRAMAQRVYRKTCLVEENLHTSPIILDLAAKFEAEGFSIRKLYAHAAAECAEAKNNDSNG